MIKQTGFANRISISKLVIAFLMLMLVSVALSAQDDPFKIPEIVKVGTSEEARQAFLDRFEEVKWTGQGLYAKTVIDDIPTQELRARLQQVYGAPTQTLEDLIGKDGFRPAECIQFEYWFVIDDKIPMMVLDVDGPFTVGFVYGGASKYIDLMPQIKRTFSKSLMEAEKLAEYEDYFYSPEREKWFLVAYQNGEFIQKEIDSPEGMTITFDY